MSEAHSTAPAGAGKPAKPYPEFPLFPHASGQWAKKVRGRLVYFGVWADPDGALKKYLAEKDALHAGRKPRESAEGFTVKRLCNDFLNAKRGLVESGELTKRSWQDYKAACDLLVSHFGKARLVEDLAPDDFAGLRRKLAKKWGPVTLGNVIQRMRVVFKYADDADLIDRPVRYGPGFKRPAKKVLRLHRAKQGPRLFTAEEICRLLGYPPWRPAASVQLEAMVLLGINSGLGNTDCAALCLRHLDLDGGWLDYPRPKTGIPHRCPLWPETVEAMRAVLAARREPKDPAHADLVFLTRFGTPWLKATEEELEDGTIRAVFDDALAKETAKLLKALGINGRKGLGFYTLRHTFRTVADEAKDQPAVDFIMGHEVPHMSSVYRETISDARLRAVADHVRAWLFARPAATQGR
jgi:integrase